MRRMRFVFLAVTGLMLAHAPSVARAATFTVTSAECDGPGSIREAIQSANEMPGVDTVTFASGLTIDRITSTSCGLNTNDPARFFLATITESIVFDGNGVRIKGAPNWVTLDGRLNQINECPSTSSGATIVSEAPGFLRVESGATVTINDMAFEDLSAFVQLRGNAELVLQNSSLLQIIDWFQRCDRPAIWAIDAANIEIVESTFELVANRARPVEVPEATVVWTAIITGEDGAVLNVVRSRFLNSASNGAIQWGGTANIVSSEFVRSGWISTNGGMVNIVNSLFLGRETFDPFARIVATDGATINVGASTLYAGYTDCAPSCVLQSGMLVSHGGSSIMLKESAIGIGLPSSPGNVLRTATGGTIGADDQTWIQPVDEQNSAELRALLAQPGLLTDPPGLSNVVSGPNYYPGAVAPLVPGALIDAIDNAEAGEANQLTSPIDATFIDKDVFGNPRVDGNGRRNIGAVQIVLSPHLVVGGVTSNSVDLSWTRPRDPEPAMPITAYGVDYREAGVDAWNRMVISGADMLGATVEQLLPNQEYEFRVTGIAGDPERDGPPSNIVSAETLPLTDGGVDVDGGVDTDGGAGDGGVDMNGGAGISGGGGCSSAVGSNPASHTWPLVIAFMALMRSRRRRSV